jgi:hypothetical protein
MKEVLIALISALGGAIAGGCSVGFYITKKYDIRSKKSNKKIIVKGNNNKVAGDSLNEK